MYLKKVISFFLAFFILGLSPIAVKIIKAQDKPKETSKISEKSATKKATPKPFPEPRLSISHHLIEVNDKHLSYTTTTG